MTQSESDPIHELRRHYLASIEDPNKGNPAKRYSGEIALGVIGIWILVVALTGKPSAWGVVIAAVVLSLAVALIVGKGRSRGRLLSLAKSGIPVWVVLVQANSLLFEPGEFDMPCEVLFSFEPAGGKTDYLSRLAESMYDLKDAPQSDPDLRYVSGLVTDEKAVKYRRRRLPVSFTGGPIVYCADLVIIRSNLAVGFIQARVLPCLAEPGEEGALELLHWRLMTRKDIPSTL